MQVNMHEAKSQLSSLTEKALSGETIIIAKAGKPLVRLVPVEQAPEQRMPGKYKGQVDIPADFDAPDKEIEDLFYED